MTNSTTRIGLALAVVLAGLGGAGHAQDDAADNFNDLTPPDVSVPRSEREYRTCPDREPRPEWLETLDIREANRGLLLMRIYWSAP